MIKPTLFVIILIVLTGCPGDGSDSADDLSGVWVGSGTATGSNSGIVVVTPVEEITTLTYLGDRQYRAESVISLPEYGTRAESVDIYYYDNEGNLKNVDDSVPHVSKIIGDKWIKSFTIHKNSTSWYIEITYYRQ